MNWTDRIKLAWKIFKREALPLYAWTLIYIGVGAVLMIAMVFGVLAQLRWALPQSSGGFYSPGMPVPGMPPALGLDPFSNPFSLHNQNLFGAFSGSMGNLSMILSTLGNLAGTLFLIIIVSWLIGTAFYTGLFNLTAKAYRERVTLKDFRYSGFLRVLGWQGIIILIEILLFAIGIIGALSLKSSHGAVLAFLIIYGLFIFVLSIFTVPWLATSAIFLLVHRGENFRQALGNSWRFFRQHMGILWGYIGTVVLIQIGIQVLNHISSGLGGLVSLVVSPFIAVLAVVWVLSLEDHELENVTPPALTPLPSYSHCETTKPSTVSSDQSSPNSSNCSPNQPISLQKSNSPLQTVTQDQTCEPKSEPDDLSVPVDRPNYCPSCGRANTGTAYCPQCGTKL
jgi:hypothetical protein